MSKCDCGATTEGKWADIHAPGCAFITSVNDAIYGGLDADDCEKIDRAWEIHKAAAPQSIRK